ncbi:MAG: hypothetical protein NZO58_02280 [Gemmataceae bacterium]|nr:hypothetical protein [Gemmataceae bacterium]
MQRLLIYLVVPLACFGAYLMVRLPIVAAWRAVTTVDEPIVQEKRPRLNVMKRTLGAIIPIAAVDKTWFVKVTGAERELEALEDTWLKFVRSLRFDNPDVPTWTLPEGWHVEEPTEKLRYKTILTGPKDKAPEIAISFLPGRQDLGSNINRWRNQLGLEPLGAMDLEGFYRQETIAGHGAYLVDLVGPGARGKAAPPMVAQGEGLEAPAAPREASLKYQAPPGWKPTAPGQFAELAFQVGEGQAKATVTVSRLEGAGGGLLANVNRWRDQVGLKPIDEAQLGREAQAITVDGQAGKLVDLSGPATTGKRIVGAIVPHRGGTYFFKFTGPSEVVGQHKAAFETFVRSVTFTK